MGKHRTQREKLEELQTRLQAGEKIPNRDIRQAFKHDYDAYEMRVAAYEAEDEAYVASVNERTQAQQNTAKSILQWKSLITRAKQGSATGDSEDNWYEKAIEDLQELTEEERNAMGCWEYDSRGNIELLNEDEIYKNTIMPTPKTSIKRRALTDAIADLLEKT